MVRARLLLGVVMIWLAAVTGVSVTAWFAIDQAGLNSALASIATAPSQAATFVAPLKPGSGPSPAEATRAPTASPRPLATQERGGSPNLSRQAPSAKPAPHAEPGPPAIPKHLATPKHLAPRPLPIPKHLAAPKPPRAAGGSNRGPAPQAKAKARAKPRPHVAPKPHAAAPKPQHKAAKPKPKPQAAPKPKQRPKPKARRPAVAAPIPKAPLPSTTAAGTPSTSTSTPGTATSAPSSRTSRDRTVSVPGGQVSVRCTGATIMLRIAQPDNNWAVNVNNSGPNAVRVRFRSSDGDSGTTKVRATCANGTPVFSVSSDN